MRKKKVGRKKRRGVTYRMRPSMYTNLMTKHIFFYEDLWILNTTRTDYEESGFDVFWCEVIEEFPILRSCQFYLPPTKKKEETNWAKK